MSNINVYMNKLLRRLQKLFKQKKGFTLIELLVVIGILGILAAALVATIDPFEQLNKAQDANTKNILVEYINANVRFYANHNYYPWASGDASACNSGNPPSNLVLCSGASPCLISGCLTQLINESELKPSFVSATGNLAAIHITYWGDSTNGNNPTSPENRDSLVGCFVPQSKSGQKDKAVHWDATGDVDQGSACVSNGGTTNCYWCTK
jgi:prepilin-type N-terminal cleavage/methylation domain-containing protein